MTQARFSISTLMAVVVAFAVNLTAGPIYGPTGMERVALLSSGALPMASTLAVGLLVLARSRSGPARGRRFLAGFEAFGVAALFAYIGCTSLFTEPIHKGVGDLLTRFVSPGGPLFSLCLTPLLLSPQLLFALLGGWLNARYRIERRPAEDPEGP